MSFISKLWQRLRPQRGLVGTDLNGNKFFEYPNPLGGRTKRSVKYPREELKWEYVSGHVRLPVQWTAWLTHTRQLPPTIEELQKDAQRQMKVKRSAAELEAIYEQERRNNSLISDGSNPIGSIDSIPAPDTSTATTTAKEKLVNSSPEEIRKASQAHAASGTIPPQRSASDAVPPPLNLPAQPEAWAPKSIQRGG